MNERYLAILANYAARDQTMVQLAVMALAVVMWLPIIDTSPFTAGKGWSQVYWYVILAAYTAGVLLLNFV